MNENGPPTTSLVDWSYKTIKQQTPPTSSIYIEIPSIIQKEKNLDEQGE
jgi:hypothetical protein